MCGEALITQEITEEKKEAALAVVYGVKRITPEAKHIASAAKVSWTAWHDILWDHISMDFNQLFPAFISQKEELSALRPRQVVILLGRTAGIGCDDHTNYVMMTTNYVLILI